MNKFLVFGNEPFLINVFQKAVEQKVLFPDFNLRIAANFTEEELEFARLAPFCADSRTLVIKAKKLASNKLLERYFQTPVNSTILYFFVEEVDKRLALYKMFQSSEIKICNKLGEHALEAQIMRYIQKQECRIKREAYQCFLGRINYALEEVNLYSVFRALGRLCMVRGEITLEQVEQMVGIREKEDSFGFMQMIMEGKYGELFRQANLVKGNVLGTLSLLLRSYRIAYKISVCGCGAKELGISTWTYIPKLSKKQADEGINIIQECLNGIKSGMLRDEMALKLCLSRLCQSRLP